MGQADARALVLRLSSICDMPLAGECDREMFTGVGSWPTGANHTNNPLTGVTGMVAGDL